MSKSGAATLTRKPSTAKRELHAGEIAIDQKPPVNLPLDSALVHPDADIQAAPMDASKAEYIAQLAFNEEPVTIMVQPGMEKFAPKFVDGWVNGKGIEVLVDSVGRSCDTDCSTARWMEWKQIPVGIAVTIKRKYVEVLAHSKQDNVRTHVVQANQGEDPQNLVLRSTSLKTPFTVVYDKNPKGTAWLQQIIGMRG